MRRRTEDMEQNEDRPTAREPWQRLLRERYDAPPEVTDMRIRATARRALAPRPARWWLPASLAASVLLAIVLVQLQFGDERPPTVLHEADVVAPVEIVPRDAAPAATPSIQEYAAPPPAEPQTRQAPAAVTEELQEVVPSPRIELPAPETPTTAVTGMSQEVPARAPTERERSAFGALHKSAANPRTPDEWYEKIAALRAAGRDEEAEAELERLEATWPGWLEQNHPQDR